VLSSSCNWWCVTTSPLVSGLPLTTLAKPFVANVYDASLRLIGSDPDASLTVVLTCVIVPFCASERL
jgi:hypothetical protein